MDISNEASQFLQQLLEKRKHHAYRIGYNEQSRWGQSKFKLTPGELKVGDDVVEIKGLTFYYSEDVAEHIDRLYISYEHGRLGLHDRQD